MRIYHRYLGFFLAGIMTIYALSGVVLIFRNNDFLKKDVHTVTTLVPNLTEKELGEQLKLRNVYFEPSNDVVKKFKQGTYNLQTGVADYKEKKYPYFINKLIKLHKATAKDPLYYLNIFFGVSLLFFVISSFFMFLPKTTIFKNGIYYTLAGIVLTVIVLFY